ncbi:hypothetical protein JW777_01275 [bacterium]|nr:hypothetical protein [bacterium]
MTLLLPLFLAWLGPASGAAVGPAAPDAVRLDVRLRKEHSSGILEWVVE